MTFIINLDYRAKPGDVPRYSFALPALARKKGAKMSWGILRQDELRKLVEAVDAEDGNADGVTGVKS
jgi:hypothetical protein